MSYRANEIVDLRSKIADLERRLRAVEQPGCCPPDPGWVLREIDGALHWVYVPSGAVGPQIGTK